METLIAPAGQIAAASGVNRRRSIRVPHIIEARIWSPTAKDPRDRMEAVSLNLSRNGVAFSVPKPLPTGAYYVIQIGFGDQKLLSEVRILSCRQVEGGQYEVGAEFS